MNIRGLRQKYRAIAPALNERSRRLWAAAEAVSIGHGGIAKVERATDISLSTISRGIKELE
ncbi:ISAzo13 family transposase, partial [Bdellovibrionota bacterium FG-1]